MPSYIEMPKLSDTMTEGTVVKWHKALGDTVEMGDVVAEVETDKAVMELEAFGQGTLAAVYVPEGGKARIGEKLALLTGQSNLPKERGDSTSGQAPVTSVATPRPAKGEPVAQGSGLPATAPVSSPPVSRTAAPQSGSGANPAGARVKASPLARKLAAAKGIDLSSIRGSGPGGRVIARDVEPTQVNKPLPAGSATAPPGPKAAPGSQPSTAPPPVTAVTAGPRADRRIPLSGMRKVIAERLLASKTQIPHFYLQADIDAAPLTRLRLEINAAGELAGLGKVTINDFILKAAVAAAVRVPRVNAAFMGDAILQYGRIHLAVAVAIEEGLVTPVIRDAQEKSLPQISAAVKDLAGRARSKKLKPEEYQGGTITVSNLGRYGIDSFSAIINPPQAVILSVGALAKRAVVNAQGQVEAGQRLTLGLSADHRVVDGAVGAQYLAALRQLLENPLLLLL